MEEVKKRFRILIEQGSNFTYGNFATKGTHGYVQAFKPEWVGWVRRVTTLVPRVFAPDSGPVAMLNAANGISLLGNGEDKFHMVITYLLEVLKTCEETIGNDQFEELGEAGTSGPSTKSNRVFVVHGHDQMSKTELEGILQDFGLEAIVLHRKPDEGQTVIEKFEKYSDVGYAFILLTPDEVAYIKSQARLPDHERINEIRARPNVIFEFGYFVGKLGRANVCCLYTGGVTLPSDVHGLLYKKFTESVKEVSHDIMKELIARGYRLSLT